MIRGLALYLLLATMQSELVAQSYRPKQVGDIDKELSRLSYVLIWPQILTTWQH